MRQQVKIILKKFQDQIFLILMI